MVQEVSYVASLHAGVNFQVLQKCQNELKTLCEHVTPGDSRLLACLEAHKRQPGFGEACREALKTTKSEEAMKKTGYRPIDAVDSFVQQHRSVLDRYGGLLLAGTLGFTALLSFFVASCLVRRSFLKGAYITVEHPDRAS